MLLLIHQGFYFRYGSAVAKKTPQDRSHVFRHYSWQLNSEHGGMVRCTGLGSMSIPLKLHRAYKLYKSSAIFFSSTIWKHCSGLLGTCIFQSCISEKYCQALAGLSALLTRHVDFRGWRRLHFLDATRIVDSWSIQYESFLVCSDTWLDHVWWQPRLIGHWWNDLSFSAGEV